MRNCLFAVAAVLLLSSCGGPVRKTAQGFRTDGPAARFEVVCYAPDIIQVVKSPLYGEVDTAPTASVTMKPGKVRFDLETLEGGLIRLTTEALRVELDPEKAVFSFSRPDGTPLLREKPEAVSHEEIYLGFLLEPGEAIYGLGQHRGPGLDQRRKNYHLENIGTTTPRRNSGATRTGFPSRRRPERTARISSSAAAAATPWCGTSAR